MPVFRKGTLLIPTGGTKHLHIVMNDPAYSPEFGDERVLIVNISTIKPDVPYDKTCELGVGCHDFVRHPSYVYYKEAVISLVPRIIEKCELGEIDLQQPVNDVLYERIFNGFNVSKHVTPKIKRYLKQQYIVV